MSELVKNIIKKNHDKTIFHALGIKIEQLGGDQTVCSLKIDNRHLQHVGLVHGGVYVLLQESVVSLAAACTLEDPSKKIVAIDINANHIKSSQSGVLIACSQCLHQGSRTLVYQAVVENQDGELLSIGRCTLMVT